MKRFLHDLAWLAALCAAAINLSGQQNDGGASSVQGTVPIQNSNLQKAVEDLFPPTKTNTDGNRINALDFIKNPTIHVDNTRGFQSLFAKANQMVSEQFERLEPYFRSKGLDANAASASASSHCGVVVYFPPGYYRCNATVDILPQVSIEGVYMQSQLAFESDYPKPPTGEMKSWVGYPNFKPMNIFLNMVGGVTKNGRVLHSQHQFVRNLRIMVRGPAIAIANLGTKNNFRVRQCVFNGSLHGGGNHSSVAILHRNLENEAEFFDGWNHSVREGFNTDGEVVDCHIEGFTYGIAGAFGHAPIISRNHFQINSVGMFLSNIHRGVVEDNVIDFDPYWHDRMIENGKTGADTGIAMNGYGTLIQGNSIGAYKCGFLLEGGQNRVANNLFRAAEGDSRMGRVVTKEWKSSGLPGEAMIQKGRNLGGPIHPKGINQIMGNFFVGKESESPLYVQSKAECAAASNFNENNAEITAQSDKY